MLAYRLSRNDLIVSLAGDLDQRVADGIRAELDGLIREYRPRRLVFELGELDFMDSSGIGMVIGRYKVMKRSGGSVAVKNARGSVEKVFALSGLYQIVDKLA